MHTYRHTYGYTYREISSTFWKLSCLLFEVIPGPFRVHWDILEKGKKNGFKSFRYYISKIVTDVVAGGSIILEFRNFFLPGTEHRTLKCYFTSRALWDGNNSEAPVELPERGKYLDWVVCRPSEEKQEKILYSWISQRDMFVSVRDRQN